MKQYSFFHAETGLFAEHIYAATFPELEINTPAGHEPIEGIFDPFSQRVDLERLAAERATWEAAGGKTRLKATAWHVVDYQPPQPSPDHVWNAEAKRWHPTPESAERTRAAAEARVKLAGLLEQQHDLTRGAFLGREVPRDAMQAIEDQIAEQRRIIDRAPG